MLASVFDGSEYGLGRVLVVHVIVRYTWIYCLLN